MPITSSDILQALLDSINTALLRVDLSEDSRGALIDQYERTANMIRDNLGYVDIALEDLPTIIRTETTTLVNEVIATFTDISEQLTTDFTTASNNALSTLDTDSQALITNLTIASNTLNATLTDNVNNAISTLDSESQALITNLTNVSNTLNATLTDNVNSAISILDTESQDFKVNFVNDFVPIAYGDIDTRIHRPFSIGVNLETHKYIHVKTNLPLGSSYYNVNISGYSYGINSVFRSLIGFYTYSAVDAPYHHSVKNYDSVLCSAYYSSDNRVCFKIEFPSNTTRSLIDFIVSSTHSAVVEILVTDFTQAVDENFTY